MRKRCKHDDQALHRAITASYSWPWGHAGQLPTPGTLVETLCVRPQQEVCVQFCRVPHYEGPVVYRVVEVGCDQRWIPVGVPLRPEDFLWPGTVQPNEDPRVVLWHWGGLVTEVTQPAWSRECSKCESVSEEKLCVALSELGVFDRWPLVTQLTVTSGFRLDFACPPLWAAVEVDEEHHLEREQCSKDYVRQFALGIAQGWRVQRVPGWELTDPERALHWARQIGHWLAHLELGSRGEDGLYGHA